MTDLETFRIMLNLWDEKIAVAVASGMTEREADAAVGAWFNAQIQTKKETQQ